MTHNDFDLVRTQRGRTIHDSTCQYAYRGKPWLWAKDKPVNEIRAAVIQFGYHECLKCCPLAR